MTKIYPTKLKKKKTQTFSKYIFIVSVDIFIHITEVIWLQQPKQTKFPNLKELFATTSPP